MLSRFKRIQLCKLNSKIPSLITSEKRRASLSSSFFLKGGMALEGCLVLPLFLFFMSTLLYGMEVVRFQNNAFSSMHRAFLLMKNMVAQMNRKEICAKCSERHWNRNRFLIFA